MANVSIDPSLCELRDGAWSALSSDKADAHRQAAHSARELKDSAPRALCRHLLRSIGNGGLAEPLVQHRHHHQVQRRRGQQSVEDDRRHRCLNLAAPLAGRKRNWHERQAGRPARSWQLIHPDDCRATFREPDSEHRYSGLDRPSRPILPQRECAPARAAAQRSVGAAVEIVDSLQGSGVRDRRAVRLLGWMVAAPPSRRAGDLARSNGTKSVTDEGGRFHHTENLYAAGPCLFPTIGSPNPMLTGIALARRTGDRIITPPAFVPDAGFESLFDGRTMGDWKMSTIRNQPGRDNPGRFLIRRGAFEAHPGTDLGLLWLDRPTPPRFVLRLQWMMTAADNNSGVFVAFPHPEQEAYDNTAYVGVNLGFEIQIDELARPDGVPIHRTGAIYAFKGPTDGPLVVRPVGEWNQYEITVDHPDVTVALNGQVVNRFQFTGDPQSLRRGCPRRPPSHASSACRRTPERCCFATSSGRRCEHAVNARADQLRTARPAARTRSTRTTGWRARGSARVRPDRLASAIRSRRSRAILPPRRRAAICPAGAS